MAHPGGIDVVYDTIGKPETFEVGVRLLKARGTLVKSGVHGPGRWEYSPLYFKEITWVGSNAFGVEEVDGVRKHGIAHFLDLASEGKVDLAGMLTHTRPPATASTPAMPPPEPLGELVSTGPTVVTPAGLRATRWLSDRS